MEVSELLDLEKDNRSHGSGKKPEKRPLKLFTVYRRLQYETHPDKTRDDGKRQKPGRLFPVFECNHDHRECNKKGRRVVKRRRGSQREVPHRRKPHREGNGPQNRAL